MITNLQFTLDWKMRETEISELPLLLQVASLIYKFCWERKEVKYQSRENYHKWKIQYTYPIPFSKRYDKDNHKIKQSKMNRDYDFISPTTWNQTRQLRGFFKSLLKNFKNVSRRHLFDLRGKIYLQRSISIYLSD